MRFTGEGEFIMSYGGVGHKEVHREEVECLGESKKGIFILGDWEMLRGMGSIRGWDRWKPGSAASSPCGVVHSSPPWWGGSYSSHLWRGRHWPVKGRRLETSSFP